jgi:hypothetical protein
VVVSSLHLRPWRLQVQPMRPSPNPCWSLLQTELALRTAHLRVAGGTVVPEAMDTVDRLAGMLMTGEGVRSLADLGVGSDALSGLDFVGTKDHWGSVGLVGLVRADDLDAAAIAARTETFSDLTRSLHRYADVLTVYTLHGSASVKLGSFGVLCFVFEQGCPKELVDVVRRQRRGSATKKEYTLAWSVDVPAATVHDHGLFPRGVFPSKRWLESAVRDAKRGS